MTVQRLIKLIATALLMIPILLLATCAYTSFSPHLRANPLASAMMDAAKDPERHMASVRVNFVPTPLAAGLGEKEVHQTLSSLGFKLDYDLENPGEFTNRDWVAEQLARGLSRAYSMGGRARFACGEEFVVEVGFDEHRLARASGYSTWTCL